MKTKTRLLLVLPVLLIMAACQLLTPGGYIGRRVLPAATNTQEAIQLVNINATVTEEQTATAEPTETQLPTRTLTPKPSPTASATPSITPTPMGLALQQQVFEDIWKTVKENYLYQDFNGLDWDAVHTEYRAKIEAGLNNDEFYYAMDEMIYSLGDDHSNYLSPDAVRADELQYEGKQNYVGIGVLISAVPDRKRATIILVYPGSPAEKAGLKAHDSIYSADGEPILNDDGSLKTILRGPEGTQVDVEFSSPGGDKQTVTITRHNIEGTPLPYQVLTTPGGKRVGYIFLEGFTDLTEVDKVGSALKDMTAEGPLDGIIIDNRFNYGGADTVVKPILGYFTKGTLGYFMGRNEKQSFMVKANDINGSQTVPLVVLTGKETASFGEISSGVLQDTKRAYLIGETTSGNVEILRGYDFSDGSRMWLAHETFRPINHQNMVWEKTGVIPDETVISEWDQVSMDTDPAIMAALKHFDEIK